MSIVKMNKVSLMVMPEGVVAGVGTGLRPLSMDRHGMTGKTNNTIPGIGQTYGRDGWGRFRVKTTYQETPGGLNTGSIEWEKTNKLDYIEDRARDQSRFGIWEYYIPCAKLDNPYGWLNGGRLDYRGNMFVTSLSDGDSPSREASGEPVVSNGDVTWEYDIKLLPMSLSNLTPDIAENVDDILTVFGLTDPNPDNCVPGYGGPDKHLFAAGDFTTVAQATRMFSVNGGASWTPFTNDPFSDDEAISDGFATLTSGGNARVVLSRLTTDVAAAAEVAVADIEFGDEAAAVFTNNDIGVTTGDVISVMEMLFYDRAYAAIGQPAAEGEIWVSANLGDTWSSLFTGVTAINAFAKGFGQDCQDVYAAGASNLIMVERDRSGVFEALVGPSGGGAFTTIAIANNGLIFAGNGQSLFVSYNNALNAGGWTALKDFGAGFTVKKIMMPYGDSNHIYVVASSTSAGEFWHSNDHGNTWNRLTVAANLGYNDAYQSIEDDNLYIIVGNKNADPLGVIHKASPSSSGC